MEIPTYLGTSTQLFLMLGDMSEIHKDKTLMRALIVLWVLAYVLL